MKPLSCAVLPMVISIALAIPMMSSAQTTHDADVHELERLEAVSNERTWGRRCAGEIVGGRHGGRRTQNARPDKIRRAEVCTFWAYEVP